MRGASCLLILLLAGGCDDDKPPPQPVAPAATQAAPAPKIVIKADGESVSPPKGDAPVDLATLLSGDAADPSAWKELAARNRAGREWAVARPMQRYRGTVARLYWSDGAHCVGLFRPPPPRASESAKEALAEPVAGLCDVVELHVRTRVSQTPKQPRADVVLELPDGELKTLDETRLGNLERAADPRGRKRGWLLRNLATEGVPSDRITAVEVVTSETTVKFSAAELSAADHQHIVEHNKKGALNLKIYAPGQRRPTRVVRNVKQIRVVTR